VAPHGKLPAPHLVIELQPSQELVLTSVRLDADRKAILARKSAKKAETKAE
jgi:hypothetical protein